MPPASRLLFQGLALRHTHAARIRQEALAEVLSACAGEGLHPVLLKGAPAAILAYPQAALRPSAISTCSPAAPTLPASRRYFPAWATAPPA